MLKSPVALAVALCGFVGLARAGDPVAVGADAPKGPAAGATGDAHAASVAMTLEEAVRRALAVNPTSETAAQEIRRAEALTKQARAEWFPTLTANGTYTRLDADRVLSGRVILYANQLQGNVVLNVPIVAGKQWAAYARAQENIGVAQAANGDARRSVAVAAARAFLTVIAQHHLLNAAKGALGNASAHEEYASTRFVGGVGNRLDAVRASQERASAVVSVKTQVSALARAQEALGVFVGANGSVDASEEPALLAPPSPSGVVSGTSALPKEAAAMEDTVRRADVVVERERTRVASHAVRDSWEDYLPLLSAIAQPFYQNPPSYSQPLTGWQAQLVLSIPLFDGGLRSGVADERRAVEAEARTRLEGALRQARSDVRVAFEDLRRADEALVAAREAVVLSHDALDLAQLAYRSGATSNIEVVDAERRVHQAENDNAIAEDASRQARLDLLAAAGRFP
jgi:outer membrane protein TolC